MSFKSVLAEMLYPHAVKCIVCGREIFDENRYGICGGCSLKANVRFCPICGKGIESTSTYCHDCTTMERYFTCARAPFIYEGNAKDIVYRLKYGGQRYLAKYMAEFLADEYYKNNWYIDFVTFVAIHEKRERKRGYNQARLIAEQLAILIDKPIVDSLTRVKYSDNFARLGRRQRFSEAEESFEAKDKYERKTILLVDDVFTTGATSGACAKALKKSGASEVYVLTFCTSQSKPEVY